MSLPDAIYSRLTGVAGVAALIDTRAYPGVAPPAAALPFITFTRVSVERSSAMGSDTGLAHARYQLSSWADTFTGAEALKEAVRAALQRWRGTVAGVEVLDSFLESEIELYEEETKLWQIVLDVMIHYRET